MYLSVATTHEPATDLGYLLMKNPDRVHEKEFAFGMAVVFFPEASHQRCEAVVLTSSPWTRARARDFTKGCLSSMSMIALRGPRRLRELGLQNCHERRLKERPELARLPIPLEVCVLPLPSRGGDDLLHSLFAPLGWQVEADRIQAPDGPSRYVSLTLKGSHTVADALSHLYVLIPVLDDDKHYWVGDDEVDKLLSKGGAWSGKPS